MQRLDCILVQIVSPVKYIYFWDHSLTFIGGKIRQQIYITNSIRTQYKINYYLKARFCIKFIDTMKV